MLFDPMFVVREPLLTLACLGVVMVGKPLAAMVIVAGLGHSLRTALTVSIGLGQIGEFSFILAALAREQGMLNERGHNVLVACAIASIMLNPLLFRSIPAIERFVAGHRFLNRLLNRKAMEREEEENRSTRAKLEGSPGEMATPLAVILGYGPVGQSVDALLGEEGIETLIVDLNLDTIQRLKKQGRQALYGDAYNITVLDQALPRATHLIITIPHATNRDALITAAKLLNPSVKVFVRAHYLSEGTDLTRVGADGVCFEEAEAASALTRLVLQDRGKDADTVRTRTQQVRRSFYARHAPQSM
jgi:CPA2 family monovalent cation:H+ antiporter-2